MFNSSGKRMRSICFFKLLFYWSIQDTIQGISANVKLRINKLPPDNGNGSISAVMFVEFIHDLLISK